jgi:DNA-binding MarR family transcriptional regulator
MDRAELTKEIIELQRQINRDIRQHTLEAWMGLNITAPQLKTMFFIADHGSTNFTKLASALGVTPPNVTGIVDRLVEHGLVSRQENPEDRRMLMLHLTEKGKSIIADLRERRVSRMSKVLSSLSLEELAIVAKGFNLLNRGAELQRGKKRE